MNSERASTIGWREWVTLPRFCPNPIQAKVDTGAKTSSIHANDLTLIRSGDETLAQFELLPSPDSEDGKTVITAPVVDFRTIRSSNGQTERRPVVRTELALGDERFEIDLTLTSRSLMGHRMLLGRRVLADRFWVDAGRSFLLTKEKSA
ncbi:MAG: ATP-dependent zinc protease family protein [Acidimicrobiales bacterium]